MLRFANSRKIGANRSTANPSLTGYLGHSDQELQQDGKTLGDQKGGKRTPFIRRYLNPQFKPNLKRCKNCGDHFKFETELLAHSQTCFKASVNKKKSSSKAAAPGIGKKRIREDTDGDYYPSN